MSDPDLTAEPSPEIAQDAVVEPTEPTTEAHPWGDDFDPNRAWNTIQNLRSREKELEQQAKQFDRLRNDPQAQREFLEELGYEVPDDEPEEPDTEPEYRDPRVDELLAEREAEKRMQRNLEVAQKELDEIQKAAQRDLAPDEIEFLASFAVPDDDGIRHLKPVWDAVTKLESGWLNRVTASKKAPRTPPKGGQQGIEEYDHSNRDERLRRMVAAMEAASD